MNPDATPAQGRVGQLDNGRADRIVRPTSGATRRVMGSVMGRADEATLTPGGAAADPTGALGTWHYGLVARWWADTSVPEPGDVAYYAAAIRRHGEPALDVGCGTGRLLLPLLAQGLDVDGTDISPDMIAHAATAAREQGHAPHLAALPTHELALERSYRTILMCGVFGIGATAEQDREALRRIHGHLRPGGTLLIAHWLPYADRDEKGWARWLPGHRGDVPHDWPAEGERRRLRDGDELELMTRLARLEPLAQRQTLEIRARLWHEGALVLEESASLDENLYFAQELRWMLIDAGFADVSIEGPHTGRPATDDDAVVIFVARR
jgi:SAM-dependent methyltransferase